MAAATSLTFTYVIGYRHQQDRIMNLRRTLEWLAGFSGIEIIIVEQDRWSKISHLNLKAKHIFIKSDMPYNRAWAFNVALKHSSTQIIAFGDSDLIMDPQQFIDSVRQLETHDVVSPYNRVIDLDQQESSLDLGSMINITRPGRGENDNQTINTCGGIVLFKKSTIMSLGGWEEQFYGWGIEDNFQTLKVEKLGFKSINMPYKCFHLWHHKAAPDMTYYERGMKILNHFANATETDMRNYINMTMPKMGMINKHG